MLIFLIGKDTGNKPGQGDKDWKDEGETEAEVLWHFLQNTAICHKPLEIFFLVRACTRARPRITSNFTDRGSRLQRWSFVCSHVSKEETVRFSHFYHTSLKCSS